VTIWLPAHRRVASGAKEDAMSSTAKEQPDDTKETSGASTRAPKVVHLTEAERSGRGKSAREQSPRVGHAMLETDGRDPVAIVDADSAARVPELVPIRYGRMLVSAFTFYRGAASLMAHDLASTPRTGLNAQLCGDAHLSNFGGFASPSRDLVFDLNDFDETLPGPFEWDLKRLAASVEIAGRDRGFDAKTRRASVLASVRSYREGMRSFAAMGNLSVWYSRLDVQQLVAGLAAEKHKQQVKTIKKAAAKAQTKDSLKAFSKLTHEVDGEPRIISDPPLIVPIQELVGDMDREALTAELMEIFRGYRRSLQPDRRTLLEGYRFVDLARKVVGVGSVGTRCWIMLLLGRDNGDPLFLQIKETGPSALESVLGRSQYRNHGQRVVEGQRLMQAASDIFLGWIHVKAGIDGQARDFYARQLWDWKTSVDLDVILPQGLEIYAGLCGSTLARAHARSGDRIAIASYLGKNNVFDTAIAEFAVAYADQNERDYDALVQAARDGRIETKEGL
jgi:uncharacterized protein (DUF2252 family)